MAHPRLLNLCDELRLFYVLDWDVSFAASYRNMCDWYKTLCAEVRTGSDPTSLLHIAKWSLLCVASHHGSSTVTSPRERYLELCSLVADIHTRKSADYGGDTGSLGNFNEALEIGLSPFMGAVVRLTDKFARARKFVKSGSFEVRDETFIDTLLDLAVYSLICRVLWEERKN